MTIARFYLDRHNVSNAAFKAFLDATHYQPKDSLNFLKDWKNGAPYARIEQPAQTDVAGKRETIRTPDKANAVYAAGLSLAINDNDPDHAALVVGNFLFGGGTLSSRLGNRIRQKEGLSYGVSSALNASPRDPAVRGGHVTLEHPRMKEAVAQSADFWRGAQKSPRPSKEDEQKEKKEKKA